ncbi:MAG TPA: glucose-6-phosphate dehydrogenase [Bryobacteraceae bacterium]|nr:glucose-6-phosphate dehydrogenase [Bryobacteraceae bacterium]
MATLIDANSTIAVNPLEKFSLEPLPTGDSCLLVIFGASGDLTRRKLIPGLYNLACVGCMNPQFEVLGIGRTPMQSEDFRAKMREALAGSSDARDFTESGWQKFENRLNYYVGDINDKKFYAQLREQLDQMQRAGSSPNRLFYVATPASAAGPVIEGLAQVGLNHSESGWTRIILEKPFGHDLNSARELNQVIHKAFDEKDVYRIDHYLGKETVQNILVFRFGNSLFEPIWNRNYIDHIEITAAETVGVEGRASFYEETGALRDMVANHLLQLLALTAMEPPIAFDADSVRGQKVQVLRSIRPMTVEEVGKRTVRGQYGPGQIGGKTVPGYRQEPNVNANSATETYAAIEFYVDNWRWAGVPFYIRTGKRLTRQLSEIRVHLKGTPQALFASTPYQQPVPNVITLRIQPNEGISIAFDAKRPGNQMRALTVDANFSYESMFGSKGPPAYETLLLDAMLGDATLFTRRDEVEAEWRIITPIEEAWAKLPGPAFPNYAAGSDGPAGANELIRGDRRVWHSLSESGSQPARQAEKIAIS